MRPLAPSERNLFLILCVAIFLAVNMLGLHSFLQAKAGLERSIQTAKSQLVSEQAWLERAAILHPAEAWINSHPMQELSPDSASADLLKMERAEAEKAGLKIVEENLLTPEIGPQGNTVSLAAKLSGPFEGVVRLLFALQSPSAWRAVEKLAIHSDAQPPNVILDLEFKQYFKSSSVSPPQNPPGAP